MLFRSGIAALWGSLRISFANDAMVHIILAVAEMCIRDSKKGYTREWINQRLQAIQVRKELTDEWRCV